MTTERDLELARRYYGQFATDDVVSWLADLLASVRREGEARALAHLRKNWGAYAVIGVAVDEAERALSKTGGGT